MSKTENFDVVIIGGGHNGLTCAAYLARTGLKVKVLEARAIVGGAAVTEEFHPGFRNSSCSYLVALLDPLVQKELELARHGYKAVAQGSQYAMANADKSFVSMNTEDEDEMYRMLETLHPGDGDAYIEFFTRLSEVADALRKMITATPPNLKGGWRDLLTAAMQGSNTLKLSPQSREFMVQLFTSSVGHMVDKWFGGDAIKGILTYQGIIANFQSPYTPGTAYSILHYVFGDALGQSGKWGQAIGGMGAISDAIASDAREHGTDIETNATVVELITKNGKASGVKMADGRTFMADTIVSNIHPRILFDKLIDQALLPAEFKREMKGYRSGSGVIRMNVALDELPELNGLPGTDLQPHHQTSILISPSVDYAQQAFIEAQATGFASNPIVEIFVPSTLDSTLAPAGKHVASLMCQYFNPELPNGKSWDHEREYAADLIVDKVTEYIPNFKKSILGRRTLTPLDLEREYGLIGGDVFHGCLHMDQMYSLRPVAGFADYRTPIPGLYMCGASTHPGGGVSGLPGRNASREILKDIKAKRV